MSAALGPALCAAVEPLAAGLQRFTTQLPPLNPNHLSCLHTLACPNTGMLSSAATRRAPPATAAPQHTCALHPPCPLGPRKASQAACQGRVS